MNSFIGKKVKKKSGKPFKSGLKVNTVKKLTHNPNTKKPAFFFEEDQSVVDAHICEIVNDN